MFVTARGHARTQLKRAIEHKNLMGAEMALREMGFTTRAALRRPSSTTQGLRYLGVYGGHGSYAATAHRSMARSRPVRGFRGRG
jgi:hypothetical protein